MNKNGGMHFRWHGRQQKSEKHVAPSTYGGGQWTTTVQQQQQQIKTNSAAASSPIQNICLAICSSVANSLQYASNKIANLVKRRGPTAPQSSATHFSPESPQPSYVSVLSPNELSPRQYRKFPSSAPNGGGGGQLVTSRLRSILKKPRPSAAPGNVPTVSYRIPVLRVDEAPRQRAPPAVPRQWEWNAHFRDAPCERVVEDRVEREECLRRGRLVAVERLTRTVRASADIGRPRQSATYI
uniref:Uncharacterized protein n=1 Tax=Globodera pallida TaxID=36090 RepID=A0A183CIL6_GLOPA